MATQAIAGRLAFWGYAATSSGAVAEVAEVKSWSIDPQRNMIDVSSNDSSGNNEFIFGQFGWTAKFDGVWARTDVEQVALRKALIAGTKVYMSLRPSTAVTTLFKGSIYVESASVSGDFAKETLTSMTVRGTGPLTYTT